MEQKHPEHPHRGLPLVLVFVLATLGATLFLYLATVVLTQGSPLLLALPALFGFGCTAFIWFLSRKQCSRCLLPATHRRLEDTLAAQQADFARLRRQNAEAERQALALQRQVAELHNSDFAVKRHESRFQVAFHATPDPILFTNATTGLVMDVNESFLRLLALSCQDVMGVPVSKLLHWQTAEDDTRFRNLRQSGSVSNLRASIHSSGGMQRQFLISARAIELEGIRSDIIIARDITDMENLRHELAGKKELLESILRHIPYYIFWKDLEQRYVGANDQYRTLFSAMPMPLEGFTDGECSNLPHHLPGTLEDSRTEDQQVMDTGQPIVNDERIITLPSGKQADVLISKVPLRDNMGNISGLLGIIADVSDLRQYERQFSMLLNGIPDPAWLKDTEGRYLVANRALAEMVGIPAAEITGKTDMQILPDDMAKRCKANEHAVIQTGIALRNDELCQINGQSTWYEVIRQPLTEHTPDATIRVIGTMGIARDISDRRKAEDEIRKLSRAIEQSSAAVAITSRDGIVEYINPRYTEISGYLPAEVYGKQPDILAHIPDMASQDLWKLIQCGEQWKGEFEATRKGGSPCWLLASISPVMDDAGTILHALIVLDDITLRKEQDEYIRFMAMHDGLTGLPNRRLFMSLLRHATAVYQRDHTPFALLFLDLNNFKKINDTLGHDAGDAALKTVAERIVQSLREVDTAARLGGDEFVVLLHDVHNAQDVRQACQRIASAITNPITLDGQQHAVGAAMGIALCPEHSTNPDELLTMADKAMYRCKAEQDCPYVEWEEAPSQTA